MAEMVKSEYAEEARALMWGWWLLLLVGLLSVAAGVIILLKPSGSLTVLAVIAGIFLLLDGVIELGSSFMRSTRNRGVVAVLGVLTAVIGVLLIRHPIGSVTAIALLIGIWLIAIGVIRIVASFDEPEHRGWRLLAGVIALVAGIVIVAVPNIGFATLAILVGIGFIVNGVGAVGLGWAMRETSEELTGTGPARRAAGGPGSITGPPRPHAG